VRTYAAHKPARAEAALEPSSPTAASAPGWALDWGRLLRTARQVAGLSLTELSARTGLSKGYLSKLESGAAGAANPTRATLAALARALPSFRSIAHMLEPGLSAGQLDFAGASRTAGYAPLNPGRHASHSGADEALSAEPIQLGWRELEVLAALLALETAAIPMPVTAPILARAVGRRVGDIAPVLDRLTAAELMVAQAPRSWGAPRTYQTCEHGTERIGVSRLGDLLVLAAALIAGAPRHPDTVRQTNAASDDTPDWTWSPGRPIA
jgi:transcriptional regulator with XRE-family HTH domain